MKSECATACAQDVFQGLDAARKRRRQRPPQPASPKPRWPAFETLEDRRLLSVSLSGGVLSVTGTSLGDIYQIYQVNGSPTYIHVVENGNDLSNTGWTGTAVTRIDVSTLGGDDTVTIQRNTEPGRDPITEMTRIWGGDGGDFLEGGPYADTIHGGDGDDFVYGFGDNDILYGGYGGADFVEGGSGNDVMYGGDGGAIGWDEVANDSLYGEEGNDALHGEGGDDILDGGDDHDTMYGGNGNDVLTGGAGNDYMDGGDGDDYFWAVDSGGVDSLLGGAGSDDADFENGTDVLLDTIPG